ncbi:TPA: molecular chaperone DnaK [Patescibacteria group bacterium]|nr:DnaK suppressor protein [candidate division SR1 bacterium RAAC1_SR1_1]HCY20862.1 molecular chaperone DnaK [Candidatus Gracilibacteria bacterium]
MNKTALKTSDIYTPEELEEHKKIILKRRENAELTIKDHSSNISSEELVGDDDRSQKASMAATIVPVRQDVVNIAEKTLKDCKNALLRIENETYGICHETGESISKEAMKASPFRTRKCQKD